VLLFNVPYYFPSFSVGAFFMRALFIAIGLALASCGGALADTVSDCVQDKDQDLRIRGCTAAIQSDKWRGEDLAWAYNNRGNAYKDKGEVDRAIADYDQALRLDPKYVKAYINRGVA
jgi:tetratricopeptide (TPR) repeat protein